MILPAAVSRQAAKDIKARAGAQQVVKYLQSVQGKRDVPAAIVVAAGEGFDDQLLFLLAVGAYRQNPSREKMLWISKTYVGIGKRDRNLNIDGTVANSTFEAVTTANMLRQPGGYRVDVFDRAEREASQIIGHVEVVYASAQSDRGKSSWSIPAWSRQPLEQELKDMERLGLRIA